MDISVELRNVVVVVILEELGRIELVEIIGNDLLRGRWGNGFEVIYVGLGAGIEIFGVRNWG